MKKSEQISLENHERAVYIVLDHQHEYGFNGSLVAQSRV